MNFILLMGRFWGPVNPRGRYDMVFTQGERHHIYKFDFPSRLNIRRDEIPANMRAQCEDKRAELIGTYKIIHRVK